MSTEYPAITDSLFYSKIRDMTQFKKVSKELDKTLTGIYCYREHQRYLANWFKPESPFDSMLLYHGVGSGKTLSSIAIAEATTSNSIHVITKNNIIIDNFMKNLKKGCEKYKVIPPKYHFKTFKQLESNLQIYTVQKSFEPMKLPENSVLIVDEAHNLSGGIYDIIKHAVQNTMNLKVILLTATPMYDNIDELLNYVPLLRKDLTEDEIPKTLMPYVDDQEKLASELSRLFKGIVSYMPTRTSFLRQRREYDLYLEPEGVQEDVIHQLSQLDNSSISNRMKKSAANMIVYPDGTYGTKERRGIHFNPGQISYHSVKLSKLYDLLNSNLDKKHVVFTNLVNKSSGSNIVRQFLEYNIRNPRIYYIDTDKSFGDRLRVIKAFNNDKTGILVTGPVISEGIRLKEVEFLHILDPHWNKSRLHQVEGRVLREGSHRDITGVVNVYHYFIKNTIDTTKHMISHEKQEITDKAYTILKSISVDCHINNRDCFNDLRLRDDIFVSKITSIDKATETDMKQKMIEKFENMEEIYEPLTRFLAAFQIYGSHRELRTVLNELNGLKIQDKIVTITDNFILRTTKGNRMYNSVNSINLKRKPPKKKTVTKTKPKTTSKKKVVLLDVDEPIYGTYKNRFGIDDRKFRVVDNTDLLDDFDNRKVNTGKVLDTFKSDELKDLLEKLGIPSKNTKKSELSMEVFLYLQENNLIY